MPKIGSRRFPYIDIGPDGIISFDYHTASSSPIIRSEVAGDSFYRFQIEADGRIEWGGGPGALDVVLRRSSANNLRLEDALRIDDVLKAAYAAASGTDALQSRVSGDTQNRIQIDNTGMIIRGPGNAAPDVYTYRDAANSLALNVNSVDGVVCRNTAVAGDTFLMIHDVDNNALERVVVGAADSLKAGFKAIGIAN